MRSKLFLLITAMAVVFLSGSARAQTTGRDFPNPLQLQAQLRDLQTQLQPRTGRIGVSIVDIDADRMSRLKLPEERGVEVTGVEEGSPADTGGMKPGDVVLTYNGENILGAQQFVRLVRETPPARKVRLSIWRNGKEQALTITTVTPRQVIGPDMNSFSNLNISDLHTFMHDVPTVIMVWNNASLGVQCEPLDTQLAEYFGVSQGVLIRSVGRGTAGEKAGLKAGDVVVSMASHPVKTPEDIRRIMRGNAQSLSVSLMRNRKQVTLNVVPTVEQPE